MYEDYVYNKNLIEMFKLNMLKMFLMYYIDYNIKIIIQF